MIFSGWVMTRKQSLFGPAAALAAAASGKHCPGRHRTQSKGL